MTPSAKRQLVLAGMIAAALGVLVLAPFFGDYPISLRNALKAAQGSIDYDIFWRIRVPRVLLAFLAGMGLAVSGMTFQAVFRNPLATPFTLGVASGASLGAAVMLRFGLAFTILGVSGLSIAAFAGALAAILFVYGLTRIRSGFSTATMLLAGVSISFFFSSIILYLQFTSDFTNTARILRWTMGSLRVFNYDTVFNVLPFVLGGSMIVLCLTHELNLMTTGEEIAISRGVNVKQTKTVLFFATSLMVGGIVAVCGPIGFVGMMSPHICRLLIGSDHRYLMPATLLFGGLFLTACDTFARTVMAPVEIPVGVITALLGGPFFIWLLISGSSKRSVI